MASIEITSFTGVLPASVYVSDTLGNNTTLVGTINSTIPPSQTFSVPPLFNNAPAIMITVIDADGCEEFKIEECVI